MSNFWEWKSELKQEDRSKRQACLFLPCIVFLSLCGCLHSNSSLSTGSKGLADETVSYKQEAETATTHESFMRQAFDLAISSGKKGNHTFGALLVYQGKVILTAENTIHTDNDISRHAEMNLLVKAKRELSPEVLRQSTLYASTAPCMLCCSAMYYVGIKRIVYGVSYETFGKLTGMRHTGITCDKLYQSSGIELEWIGPILEEEGLKVFEYWPQRDSFQPLSPEETK